MLAASITKTYGRIPILDLKSRLETGFFMNVVYFNMSSHKTQEDSFIVH